jgi:hypothetical protein
VTILQRFLSETWFSTLTGLYLCYCNIMGYRLYMQLCVAIILRNLSYRRSQWPHGPRCWFASARPLKLWVQTPAGSWIFICCECCVFSGKSLCDELITHPEEFYRVWGVVVCDLETSKNEKYIAHVRPQRHRKKENYFTYI